MMHLDTEVFIFASVKNCLLKIYLCSAICCCPQREIIRTTQVKMRLLMSIDGVVVISILSLHCNTPEN